MKIINFEKKLMISLTNKELQSCASQENRHICKKRFKTNTLMSKLEITVTMQVITEVLHIAYAISNTVYLTKFQ